MVTWTVANENWTRPMISKGKVKFGIWIRQRNMKGVSNNLCWLWGKSIFFFSFKWLAFNSKGWKTLNLELQKWSSKILIHRGPVFKLKQTFMTYGVYIKNNNFCYFHSATLCSFVPLNFACYVNYSTTF